MASHSNRNKRPRAGTSPSMEQYVETIAQLLTKGKVCSVSDIAESAEVSRPAASRAVRDLAAKELVEHKAYGYVNLTTKGHRLALRLSARHETLLRFLQEVLGYDPEQANDEACRLEHHFDDETAGRIGRLVDFFASNEMVRHEWDQLRTQLRQEPDEEAEDRAECTA